MNTKTKTKAETPPPPTLNNGRHIKEIYDEVTEDIFDMSNVRIFKEVEKKKMRDVYTLLFLRPADLTKSFGLALFQNICSDAAKVQDCWNLAKTRVKTKKICLAPKCSIFK